MNADAYKGLDGGIRGDWGSRICMNTLRDFLGNFKAGLVVFFGGFLQDVIGHLKDTGEELFGRLFTRNQLLLSLDVPTGLADRRQDFLCHPVLEGLGGFLVRAHDDLVETTFRNKDWLLTVS